MIMLEIGAGSGPHWMGGPGSWWIVVPLIWVLLVGVAVWLLARRRDDRNAPSGEGAVGVLATRYARGEIETDEFRQRIDEIRGSL